MEAYNITTGSFHEAPQAGILTQLIEDPAVSRAMIGVLAFTAAVISYVFGAKPKEEGPPLMKRTPGLWNRWFNPNKVIMLTELIEGGQKEDLNVATVESMKRRNYFVLNPLTAAQVFRSKHLGFLPYLRKNIKGEVGVDERVEKMVKETEMFPEVLSATRASLNTLEISRMNMVALQHVAAEWDKMKPGQENKIDNLYRWQRDLLTVATCQAMYGPANPFVAGSSLVDDIWTYEESLMIFLINVEGAKDQDPKAWAARERLQAALAEYYEARGDAHPDAAKMTHDRAETFRQKGLSGKDIGTIEVMLLRLGTSNSIPLMFWVISQIMTDPELLAAVHKETAELPTKDADGNWTLDIDDLDKKVPLLESIYKECLRLTSRTLIDRSVTSTGYVSDGTGNEYLFEEGKNARIPGMSFHLSKDLWGDDAEEFRADRFLSDEGMPAEKAKERRAAYMPFGGGRHMCPGREFAHLEILATMVSVLQTFHIEPVDGDRDSWVMPVITIKTSAICKPEDEEKNYSLVLKRKEGEENARWTFKSTRVEAAAS